MVGHPLSSKFSGMYIQKISNRLQNTIVGRVLLFGDDKISSSVLKFWGLEGWDQGSHHLLLAEGILPSRYNLTCTYIYI